MIVGGAVIVAAIVDIRLHRIPNWLTGPLLLTAIVLQGVWSPEAWWKGVGAALFAAGLAFVLHFVLWWVKLEGAGDAKLMMGISALMGWPLMLEMSAWRYVLLIPYAIATITVLGRWPNFRLALRWTFQKFLGQDPGEKPEATYMPFGPLIALSLPLAMATPWLDYFAP